MSPVIALCMSCEHFEVDVYGFKCKAYPLGIPDAIIDSEADHRKPYKGDHGITYEQRKHSEI